MSRSYNEHHPIYRGKFSRPSAVLGMYYKNGYKELIFKHIRLKPYGRKNFIGYGEEEYSYKYGYYFATQTNKKMERRNGKKLIENELLEMVQND